MPQGSILGPILFNIYINDLADNIHDCLLIQYADDTQFLHTSDGKEVASLIHKTEETLKCLKKYFLMNGLMLNSKKTQCIFIGSKQILAHVPLDTVIKVDGEFIIPSNNVKKLGVHIDRFMLFDKHIVRSRQLDSCRNGLSYSPCG